MVPPRDRLHNWLYPNENVEPLFKKYEEFQDGGTELKTRGRPGALVPNNCIDQLTPEASSGLPYRS